MTVLNDLKLAIQNYETDSVKTEIVNFTLPSSAGSVLNVGEVFLFQVRATNEGPLDMKQVTLRVLGTEFADVATLTGQFGASVDSPVFTLDAGQVHTTVVQFRGRAKMATGSTAKNIVLARIQAWNASLEHLLNDQTGAGQPEGRLSKVIAPN